MVADLGYVGIETVPYKRFPGSDLDTGQVAFNTSLSTTRAAVEHARASRPSRVDAPALLRWRE
jgi:hypothetical protein